MALDEDVMNSPLKVTSGHQEVSLHDFQRKEHKHFEEIVCLDQPFGTKTSDEHGQVDEFLMAGSRRVTLKGVCAACGGIN